MNVQERYNEVEKFNRIAGNLTDVTVAKLEAQMKVFIEESKETADAFSNKDSVELLDGICDSFVTLAGLMQMAEKMGFKVDEALKRVNENNLSKFPTHVTYDAKRQYEASEWRVVFDTDYRLYILKDSNGKVRKPVGFKPVQISDLVPDIFSEKMTWKDALEKIKGTNKYIVQDHYNQQMQYQVIDGKVCWTHFGSVGGDVTEHAYQTLLNDSLKRWTVKNSPYGGVV